MTHPSSLSNHRGMSLAELLISTVIVGFMVAGIFSSYYALQNMDRGASRRAAITLELMAVAQHMRHNIALAHGTINNPGIDINNGGGSSNYICARQDIPPTPNDFTDDQWACYTWRMPNPRDKIEFCLGAAAGPCAGTFIGRSFRIPANNPQWSTTTGMFSMLLVNRYDNSAGEAVDSLGKPTQGDEANPQAVYRLEVHPDAYSFR